MQNFMGLNHRLLKQVKPQVKPFVFLLSLLPFVYLGLSFYLDNLGANPIEQMTHQTGIWALRFLLLGLCITPLRRLTGNPGWIKIRRMLGLFAFFYVCLHLMTYLWLDQYFYWPDIYTDIIKRPFITVGFLAFIGLVPLAITSNRFMIKKLGKGWVKLHKLVYLIAVLAILHFWWKRSAKLDIQEPMIYAGILFFLLGFRVFIWISRRTR